MRLLLIAPSTRAMAESAVDAGYDFVSLDFFGDVDQREICSNYSLSRDFHEEQSIENLFKHRRDAGYTHVVYGSGFENHPELVEVIEKESTLLGNSSKTIRRVRDWDFFFKTLKKIGIKHPGSRVVDPGEARELVAGDDSLIVKPIKTGGGHAIYDHSSIDGRVDALGEKVLVQEYVEGIPASATVLASHEGCFFLGATEQLIGDSQNRYRYTGNIAPLDAGEEVMEKIARISLSIARAFRLRGSNTVDFILRGDEPIVTEVNPRLTGAMEVLESAYGVNLLDLHVRACMNDLTGFRAGKPKGFLGKKILFAEEDVKFIVDRLAFVKDVPRYGERIMRGSPICTVLGYGSTRQGCIQDLRDKETIIRRGLSND